MLIQQITKNKKMKKAPIFAKKLLEKAANLHHIHHLHKLKGCLTSEDLDFRVALHYGIPSTASSLVFDPIQRLLAIGYWLLGHCKDGRIKVIGGDNIEGLLISPQTLAYKYLKFLSNKGYLVSISNDNDIQKISRRTEDLRNGAEDFASLANELVKEMERRKWWQI